MRFKEFRPPENLCSIEIGQLFRAEENGKLYRLVHRDVVKCIVLEWTWWEDFKNDIRGFIKSIKEW
jgi:hypothetical protein